MNSSGMKRGLAASAIAALAVTGLPFAAHATTVNAQVGSNVVLYSQFAGNGASLKNDGTDSTIRLEAGAPAGVSALTFQYQIGSGDWHDIATVSSRNDDGAFSYEWDASSLSGATVNLRATSGGATPAVSNTVTGAAIQGGGAAANSVNIASGTDLGVFQAPYTNAGILNSTATRYYAVVGGTTSATSGNVALTRRDGSGAAVGNTVNAPVAAANGATTGTFSGALDLNGYSWSGDGSADQVVIGAVAPGTGGTDDVESFSLYKQVITSVTATPDRTQVPSGQNASVTVTVKDQNGNPIMGAWVKSSNDGILATKQITDAKGQVTFNQGAGSAYYYANATNSSAFEPDLGDKKSDDVTVTEYAPVPNKLAAASTDGAAFDRDEYATGDITVQVKDQAGNNFDVPNEQDLQYYWVITPFDGSAPVRVPAATATPNYSSQGTETGGKFVVDLPTNQPDGTYDLYGGLTSNTNGNNAIASSKLLTVKTGDADVVYGKKSPQQALAGGSTVVNGTLELADGTGLPKRDLALHFERGSETGPNADAADAGIVGSNGNVVTDSAAKTGDDGTFAVTVKDPAQTPQAPETGGYLDVTPQGNAGWEESEGVDFLASVAPASISFGGQTDLIQGEATPGRPVRSSIKLFSADGTALSNQTVTLSIDHGFFTPHAWWRGQLVADPAAAEGGLYGAWKSLGQQITVTTNGNGYAPFTAAIGKDAGFDDDGAVTSTVTAAIGSVTKSDTIDWYSQDPLNGGSVTVKRADANDQTVGVLPKAPTTESVKYDVYATDQFGNLVPDVQVDLTDNLGGADVNGEEGSTHDTGEAWSELSGDAPAVTISSGVAGDQAPTATWDAPKTTWTDGDTSTAGFQPSVNWDGKNLSGTGETTNWYEIDFAHSTYTLTHDSEGNVPVGSTVLETYKAVDQNGEPIWHAEVGFFRTGPDEYQDGDWNSDGLTNQQGQFSYLFAGAKAGTATVQGVIVGGSWEGGDQIVPESRATDTVTFGESAPEKVGINLKVTGASAGDQDHVTANANDHAAGLTAVLYRKGVEVKSHKLDSEGNWTFSVADTNGKRFTKYTVKVAATDTTKAASKSRLVK